MISLVVELMVLASAFLLPDINKIRLFLAVENPLCFLAFLHIGTFLLICHLVVLFCS